MTPIPRAKGLSDLRALLALLHSEGELVEIETPVAADLEAAEIHRRVIAAGGPALLFKNIEGSPFPVVTNLFGSRRRVELAFGPRPEAVVQRLAEVPHRLLPPSPGALWQQRDLVRALLKVGRRRRRRTPATEVVDRPPALDRLPLLRTWPEDGGPFLTLPLVLTEHPTPENGANLGIYRVQRHTETTVGLHCQIHKGGGFHLAAWEELGRPMPVNIHVGGPPALVLAAIAPLPENVPETLLASLVLGDKLLVGSNPAGPLPVLGTSEFTLVGTVAPGARHPEGPFGDHYGYYSLRHDYPLVQVDALLRRRDPILTATVVGKPRQEDFYLGEYLQELLLPFAKLAMTAVTDLWSYGEPGFHSLAAAVVRERYRREAMVSAFRILGEGQLSLTKFLLLTDTPRDLRDFPGTLEHVLARVDFRHDLFVFSSVSMDTLDYTGPQVNEGSKGVLLGLGEPIRKLPRELPSGLPAGVDGARVFCGGCLVVSGPGFLEDPGFPGRLARDDALVDWPLVVLVDDADRAARSSINFLWTTFTRFEPAADLHARATELVRHKPAYTPPLVIDARMRPEYPDELFCDPDTGALVERRWRDYFPSIDVPMGDSDRAHLD